MMDPMELDDSDFYGDEATVAGLNQRVEDFDVDEWCKDRALVPLLPTARLPPATTDATFEVPWIYICNPYIPRKPKALAQNQKSRGNEDEGPEEHGSDLSVATSGGMERLHLLTSFIQGALAVGGNVPAVLKDIENEKMGAMQDILNLAHACKVRCGKWMIFCDALAVNEVWEIIARATANNELGIAAKVAPRPGVELRQRERLICVYTSDFRDRRDVGRVLRRLRELGFVSPSSKEKTLYYKPGS
ncbi:unnamed protein product [Parascedosporium putredinis]|uniref:DUF1917-domain-containing protein n=1 Tax=Parascedosporium putredinis TaxID=1442378 RepID=A0A9P1H2A8_9PEZI|nr:unnamed protein product [Parascedosporium putredinis]CAI7994624.1 unnamed protein product [Parascedosporium putredinis]